MEVRITTLTENTARNGLLGEWGLSMLVEADGRKILFDTGQTVTATHNADALGADLAAVDAIVLSHGHLDHTGGLRGVLKKTGPKPVIAHPKVWEPKYVSRQGEPERNIGLPFTRPELEQLGASFRLSAEPVKLADSIMTTGEIPMVTDFETLDPDLYVKENGQPVPDSLPDDLSLIINADFGLVVVLGCAHRGIINTLRHALALTGRDRVYAAIGGTHLFGADEERLVLTVAALREMGIERLGVSHCTGFYASAYLAMEFGSVFFLNNAGSQFTLPF